MTILEIRRNMQKVIFVLISIIILSLIGCGGLVGQGTGNEKSTNSDQIQSDLVEALEKVVKLTEESEQLRSEIDTLNQQADNIRADIEEDWQKRNEELEKNYQDEINKLIKRSDDSNRKVDEARIRLEDALRTIEDLNKESLRLQGELSKALNK